MSIEVNGTTYETDEEGYLVNLSDWNEDVANEIAKGESVEMTPNHWEVVNFLRQYYDESGGPELISRMALVDCRTWLVDVQHNDRARVFWKRAGSDTHGACAAFDVELVDDGLGARSMHKRQDFGGAVTEHDDQFVCPGFAQLR